MSDEDERITEEDAIVRTPNGIRWKTAVIGNSPEVFDEE